MHTSVTCQNCDKLLSKFMGSLDQGDLPCLMTVFHGNASAWKCEFEVHVALEFQLDGF